MNIKVLNLSTVLAALLFTSPSPIFAMEREDKPVNPRLAYLKGAKLDNLCVSAHWSLLEIRNKLRQKELTGEFYPTDIMNYISNYFVEKIEEDSYVLPEFPIDGWELKKFQFPLFSIKGKHVRGLLLRHSLSSPHDIQIAPENKDPNYYYGVTATKLKQEHCMQIPDNNTYFVKRLDKDEVEIKGLIPRCYKIFTIQLNKRVFLEVID